MHNRILAYFLDTHFRWTKKNINYYALHSGGSTAIAVWEADSNILIHRGTITEVHSSHPPAMYPHEVPTMTSTLKMNSLGISRHRSLLERLAKRRLQKDVGQGKRYELQLDGIRTWA